MNFYIRQTATTPILKMRLIDDGRNDKSSFNDLLENSEIFFEMYDIHTNEPVILNADCYLTTIVKKYNFTKDEYYITYKFTEEQTAIAGKYEGKFIVNFMDTNQNYTDKLILPIKEKLYIDII